MAGTIQAREGRTDGHADPIPALFQGATQDVSFSGTATYSTAVGNVTTVVRLRATQTCRYRIGDVATIASGGGTDLDANCAEYRAIRPGQRISVIKPAGGTDGVLNIEECAS